MGERCSTPNKPTTEYYFFKDFANSPQSELSNRLPINSERGNCSKKKAERLSKDSRRVKTPKD